MEANGRARAQWWRWPLGSLAWERGRPARSAIPPWERGRPARSGLGARASRPLRCSPWERGRPARSAIPRAQRWRGPLGSLAGLGLVLALAGCPGPSATGPGADSPPPFNPQTAGAIEGVVVWQGPRPVEDAFSLGKVRDACGARTRESYPNPNLPIIGPGGGVSGAVVFLDDVPNPKDWDIDPVVIDLVGCEIVPHVAITQAGAKVSFKSSDPARHAILASGADAVNLVLAPHGLKQTQRFDRPGLIELQDLKRPWMHGFIHVADHPYYALTDRSGRYRLTAVPPGRYTLHCWHANWALKEVRVRPEDQGIAAVRFAPPIDQTRPIELAPHGTVRHDFHLALGAR